MLASIFSLNVLQTALELGCIYGLVALALFLSYSILNIADLSTDGCFTLGCAVACQVALTGHPILALAAAMAAGICSGFVSHPQIFQTVHYLSFYFRFLRPLIFQRQRYIVIYIHIWV